MRTNYKKYLRFNISYIIKARFLVNTPNSNFFNASNMLNNSESVSNNFYQIKALLGTN